MKRHAAVAVTLSALLAGCATWGDMDKGLSALHGSNLAAAVSVLGYPSSESRVAGMRQVIWSSSNSGVMYVPQSSTTTGSAFGTGGFANYTATTSYMAPMAYNYACTIILRVSDQDVILGHQYQGNMGGCEPYIKALKRAAKIRQRASAQAAIAPRPVAQAQGQGPTSMKDQATTYLGCVAIAMSDHSTKTGAAAQTAKNAAIASCEGELKKFRTLVFQHSQLQPTGDPIKAADEAETALRQQARRLIGA